MTYYCKICGLPVDPKVDVAFGAKGKVLFAAHRGKCEDTVRASIGGARTVAETLLRVKAPRLHAALSAVGRALKEG